MRPAPRRALVGVLSIAAVLLPAAGIAYLGAVSYREDRGIVAARLQEQFAAARTVAAAVEAEVLATLEAVSADAQASRDPVGPGAFDRARSRRPLAAFPFHIRAGRLRFPAPEPLGAPASADGDVLSLIPRTCPERGFDRCILAIRAARGRQAQLEAARRREAGDCAQGPCARDAARAYAALARWDDTGPDALLGLARIARRRGDAGAAVRHYRALGDRFGGLHDTDQVSYALIADVGAARATASPDAALEVLRALVARRYQAPAAILDLVADDLIERLRAVERAGGLADEQSAELAALAARVVAARRLARFAVALAGEVDELSRSATRRARGRPALARSPSPPPPPSGARPVSGARTAGPGSAAAPGAPLVSGAQDPALVPDASAAADRTLIYFLDERGDVIGIVVDEAMLEQVAARSGVDLGEIAAGARAIVERLGHARPEGGLRTLASVGFGPVLPHLQLALVNARALPDPLDESIEARGRRHLAITGALVALLLLGLVATIRGAGRARELARLKSDFVSTVSHELKTPLTSIRMFGEMLQQGVAAGDRAREARYQGIIVKESERLGLLIANLLDYAQIERGTRRYDARPERAVELAREAVDTFLRVQEGSAPPVRLGGDAAAGRSDTGAEVLVDREVVVQSLLNLLSNAAKYGGGGEPIDVAVGVRREAGGASAVLSVTDRGPGIPASEHERIFREFYRAPAAYASGVEGTGLGLALVKRHVEAQGGRVEVDSAPGRGATFSLVFPVARPAGSGGGGGEAASERAEPPVA